MKKPIIKNTVKIILGFILCYLISGLVNYFVGYTLFELSESNLITIERTHAVLEFYVITYLGFLIPLIIIGILIIKDFFKDKKENVLWKVILIVLFYLTFEFNVISKLLA